MEVSQGDIVNRLVEWHTSGRPTIEPPRRVGPSGADEMPRVCPSQPEGLGTITLGTISPEGRLRRSVLRDAATAFLEVTDGEVRYAGDCYEHKCSYWAGSCQLAGVIVRPEDRPESLDPCGVRGRCRWFLEHGPAACGTCARVSYLMEGRASESP